jgi:hypothetical protein
MFNQFQDYVQQPDYKHRLVIYSDGNDDYKHTLPEYFHKDVLCYGQKIKSQDGVKLFPAIRRKVFGNPSLDDIDTNANECINSILRGKLARFNRRTKAHSKQRYNLQGTLFVFQFYWNFIHKNAENLTPAILEKQTSKVWTWGKFLHTKLKYSG